MSYWVRALVGAGAALPLLPATIWLFRHTILSTPRRQYEVLVVALTVVACAAVATWPPFLLVPGCLTVLLGVPASVVDLAEHRIPDRLSVPLAACSAGTLTAGIAFGATPDLVGRAMLSGAAWAGLLLLSFLISGHPGPGDVKFAPGLGVLLGWFGWTWLLAGVALTYLSAAAAGLLGVLTGKLQMRGVTIPMSPAMTCATLAVVTWASLR